MANGNGTNGKLTLWLIGLCFPALVGTGAGLINNLRQYDARMATLEAQIQGTAQRLEMIERKLDRIIDHQHSRD